MSETIEITTEQDAREFVEDADGQALHLPIVPMIQELWFVQAGDHFAVVTLDMGNLGLSRPAGDDATIHNEGEAFEINVVDEADLPFELDEVSEVAAEEF